MRFWYSMLTLMIRSKNNETQGTKFNDMQSNGITSTDLTGIIVRVYG